MTAFCGDTISLWDDLRFFVDGNSKITRENGSYEHPTPNAFSLPHVSSCPGSTSICRKSCYVHGLEKNAPAIFQEYKLNAVALHRVLLDDADAQFSAELLGDWISMNARHGFRWHVSGDVMSQRHAEWIVEVCRVAKSVPHWIYTRSFPLVGILLGAKNLTINLSADEANWLRALATWTDTRIDASRDRVRLTYLTHDGQLPINDAAIDVIFPDYTLRGRDLADPTSAPWWQGLRVAQRSLVCPADFFGQSQAHRCGPCKKCL